ncbi:MAG TPA: hypothetical protein VKB96_15475 [Gammaproteobacteria bacterium]|nr:hypothetical protein [Gammaproteobacteria bacterium]
MRIDISLDTDQASDLGVLFAIVAALGGRGLATGGLITPDAPKFEQTGNVSSVSVEIPQPPVADEGEPAPIIPGETDIHGREWNAEVHASTRAKNADGSWRYKRGVDKALVEAFEAQPVGNVIPEPADTVSETPVATTAAEIPAPDAVIPEPVAVVPDAPTGVSFAGLMKMITGSGMETAKATGLAQSLGLGGLADLAKPDNAALIPAMVALVEAE